jgi:copper/silver efflux system protein
VSLRTNIVDWVRLRKYSQPAVAEFPKHEDESGSNRSLLGVPKVKDIRGFSDFGYSYVYIVFGDGTDIYWARSRTLEYLSNILPNLPQGVNVELARDETAVGWIYEYALVDKTGKNNLAQLRSFQDWNLRYALQAVPGVAEVAPLGGFVRQYQVNVDPNALLAFDIPIDKVAEAMRQGNSDAGGRLVEFTGREYIDSTFERSKQKN